MERGRLIFIEMSILRLLKREYKFNKHHIKNFRTVKCGNLTSCLLNLSGRGKFQE